MSYFREIHYTVCVYTTYIEKMLTKIERKKQKISVNSNLCKKIFLNDFENIEDQDLK